MLSASYLLPQLLVSIMQNWCSTELMSTTRCYYGKLTCYTPYLTSYRNVFPLMDKNLEVSRRVN